MTKKKKNKKAPTEQDLKAIERDINELLPLDMRSVLRNGPYPPINFHPMPFLSMFSGMRFEEPEPAVVTDCVRETYEDRLEQNFHRHTAFVSDFHADHNAGHYSGAVVSIVESEYAPPDSPINLAVVHNIDGQTRVNNCYLSIESAETFVNQLSHAIGIAKATPRAATS